VAVVLAATELTAPAAGFATPHRIALASLSDDVRVLGLVEGPLPPVGSQVIVELRDGRYVCRAAPGPAGREERGEGESPGTG